MSHSNECQGKKKARDMQGGRCCRQKKKKKESISCKRSDEYERVGELQVPQSKINLSTDHMPAKESSE